MSRVKELEHLIHHLKFFGNLDEVEVPSWVRPAVKQALTYKRVDLALGYLEGQLKIEEILAQHPSKKKLLAVLGFEKKDLGNTD